MLYYFELYICIIAAFPATSNTLSRRATLRLLVYCIKIGIHYWLHLSFKYSQTKWKANGKHFERDHAQPRFHLTFFHSNSCDNNQFPNSRRFDFLNCHYWVVLNLKRFKVKDSWSSLMTRAAARYPAKSMGESAFLWHCNYLSVLSKDN